MTVNRLIAKLSGSDATERLPALFLGHSSPMNAIEDNRFSKAWHHIAAELPRPKAVLCVSAHWLTEGSLVHGAERPKTIHDFWGFPKELYDVRYPCPGEPALAEATRGVISSAKVGIDHDWGLDHGAWSVLRRMYPNADVPVFQLSLDMSRPSAVHYDIGKELATLRDRGVLIVGSGNLVHNLGLINFEENAKPFDWAADFDATATILMQEGDHKSLIHYEQLGHAAAMSVPTPDHYWPLLYVLGAARPNDAISFPVVGLTNASISMRAVRIG